MPLTFPAMHVLRGPLAALLAVVLVVPPPTTLAAPAQQVHSKYSESNYAALEKLITTTPVERMDLEFLKKIYRFENAKDMLKLMLSRSDLRAQSEHLANVRKNYIWKILAEYARKYYTVLELTNQGKSIGLTSDYDVTGNILEYNAEGELVLRDGVNDVIKYLVTRLKDDFLSPDALDITLFNGDVFLPDPRDERLSIAEYMDKSLKGVHDLRKQNGAYWAPGGNKEQTHDQALDHGRTVQISHDHASGRDTVNGQPVDLEHDTGVSKGEELPTKEAVRTGQAVRYQGVEDLSAREAWRRSLGDITQNVKEFFTHDDPVARNKYFIERIIDQGAGRFADLPPAPSITGKPETPPTYVQMHGADSSKFGDPQRAAEVKKAWKEVFIQRSFGLKEKDPRIEKIQKILDRSADIQLDKVDKSRNASYEQRAKSGASDYYFGEEWDSIEKNPTEEIRKLEEKYKSAGQAVPPEELRKLKESEARRLFFEAQGELIPEAAVHVAEETFRREAVRPESGPFADARVDRKLKVDRGIEMGGLLEIIQVFPGSEEAKKSLRKRLIDAVPESSRPEVYGMMEIARRKLALTGLDGVGLEKYTKASDGISDRPLFLELAHENVPPADPPIPKEAVRDKFSDLVEMSLGPEHADQFREAWKAGKTAAVAKFGAKAYMKEITEQVDGLMLTGAALGMINVYQQSCISQTSWNETCLTALAGETFNQVLFMLPFINSGYMIASGINESREGRKEGLINVAMGVLSIPGVANQLGGLGMSAASVLHIYVAFQLPLLAAAVTYGYAVQRMTNDGVEQAFKALREPGKHARPFPTANRSAIWNGDTPTIPLLADVISGKDAKGQELVPADNMTDAERNRVAMQQSAPAIHAELYEMGYQVGTPEWQAKRRELVVRYGMQLPYLQRMARIHQYFGPKMAAVGENDDMMPACLSRINEDIEKKYGSPPELVDRLRYSWNKDNKEKDRQKDLASGWSECVERAVAADETHLAPMFNHYLNGWFGKQEGDYRRVNETTLRPLLCAALMREYVIHRYLDQNAETERQMKRALNAVKEQSEAKLELMGKLMAKEQGLAKQFGEKFVQSTTTHSPVKPKLVLRTPPFAVRVGEPANVDISAHGQFDPQDSGFAAGKEWKADIETEVTKVSLGAPANLIVTPKLRSELTPEKGKPKQVVTIEEKLRAKLKDVAGAVVANAEASITYYDLVDWEGAIDVEVRAAGAETKDPADRKQTTPYPYALVKLSGPAQAEKEASTGSADSPAIASFSPVPEGSFTIHVSPRSTDYFHRPAEATVALAGISQGTDEAGKPVILMGSGAETVTVVLPYVPAADARNTPPPKPAAPAAPVASPTPSPAGPAPHISGAPAIDTQLAADCEALLRKGRAALSGGDLTAARSLANEAGQHKCGDSPSAGPLSTLLSEINQANDQQNILIAGLRDTLRNQMGACQYEAAAATARQLSELAPNDSLAEIQAQLEKLAALQATINSLLAAAANPANDAEAADTLGRLREVQSQAPQCMLPLIANAIATLNAHLAGPAARDRIRAAIAACDYIKALAAAMELQAVNPNDEWLKANLGLLQAAAAEQTNVLSLLRQVKSAAPGSTEAGDLAARLRQALTTAPSCLTDLIQTGLGDLGRGSGQKPAWLDSPTQPGSDTTADSNLNHARQILQLNTQEEVNHQATLAAQQQQAQASQPPPQPQRPDPTANPPVDPQRQKEVDSDTRRRKRQETFNNLASTLGTILSSSLGGGKIPIPQIPGGTTSGTGGASAPDPFVGSWMCHMRLTASRKMPLDGSVQGDYRETISKTANGYYLTDGRSGDSMPSTYVTGNSIRFSARSGSGSMTMDFQAAGSRMTGTLHGINDDDNFTASLQCGR